MGTNWQAYADLTSEPGYVQVTIGQFTPNEATLLDFDVIAHRIAREEGTRISAAKPLDLPVEVAEALYRALDRIFGSHHEQGVTDVLTAALQKEQARVDFVLSRTLGDQIAAVRAEPVG